MKETITFIPFGSKTIPVKVPEENLLSIVSPNNVAAVKDETGEVKNALRNPIGCNVLPKLVKNGDKIVVISDDNTRPTPAHIIIPVILDELNNSGVVDEDIKIIMALGTHRYMIEEELGKKLGNDVLNRVEVKNHDYQNQKNLINLGIASHGTPISINRDVLEADFVIGVGNIVPHHILGWAGGAKIIKPGVSGEATTAGTHLLGVRQGRCLLGEVESIVRQEMEDIAQKAGLRFIVNTILNRDGRITKVVAGDTIKAFRYGVEEAKKVCEVSLPAKADIVIAGSHPCDLEFWQAHKSLYSADIAVKEGGTIITVTPCLEGVSMMHPEILDFAGLSSKEIDHRVRTGEIKDGTAAALAIAWAMVREKAEIIMVSSGISEDEADKLGYKSADNVEEALSMAFKKQGPKAKVTILTHAPEVLPVIRSPL